MTTEEIIGLETAKIAQMELKDGTIVMIKNEEEVQPQEEVAQEEAQEVQQEEVAENAENVEGQENQLRARPGFPHMRPAVVPMRPAVVPMRPAVVPMRPAVVPRPLIAPRGPMVRPMAPMGVFRARPGMPIHRPPVVAPKVVPVPMHRPVVPVPVPVHRPMVPGKPGMLIRPAVAPMPIARPVFRARPNTEPEAEAQEAEYQEEEYNGEEQYCECEEGQEGQQVQEEQEGQEEQVDNLRARPMMMMPMGPRMRPPMIRPPPMMVRPRPPVPVVPVMPVRRGPMMGYNTFQPRVFRARPHPRIVPTPMFVPVNPTFQPKVVRGPIPPPMHHPHMHPMRPYVFRGKEASNGNDAEEQQQCENQCNKSVCTKCGKEF
jgi:hypothetical protein